MKQSFRSTTVGVAMTLVPGMFAMLSSGCGTIDATDFLGLETCEILNCDGLFFRNLVDDHDDMAGMDRMDDADVHDDDGDDHMDGVDDHDDDGDDDMDDHDDSNDDHIDDMDDHDDDDAEEEEHDDATEGDDRSVPGVARTYSRPTIVNDPAINRSPSRHGRSETLGSLKAEVTCLAQSIL